MGPMCGLNQRPAAPSCGKLQCDGAQLQFQQLTSGRRNDMQHNYSTATTPSVHPLVPLLLCSDRLLPPPSPPYERPIGIAAAAAFGPPPRPHGEGVPRQVVKKPLNAFMLYMKATRQEVLQEGRQRESAAVNRVLGRRWNALPPAEQAKYYELAHRERLLHRQLHPGWSARDNYGKRKKKQKVAAGSLFSWTLTVE